MLTMAWHFVEKCASDIIRLKQLVSTVFTQLFSHRHIVTVILLNTNEYE